MVTVPAFLLRRLYVKSSLKSVPGGFEFQLRNRLGSGYAHKMWPLTLDGEEVPIENTPHLTSYSRDSGNHGTVAYSSE